MPKTPVKQADNLPNTPKPIIIRPPVKQVPITWNHPKPKAQVVRGNGSCGPRAGVRMRRLSPAEPTAGM
jgi:hypothetical protein